jgi:hypothetical protein
MVNGYMFQGWFAIAGIHSGLLSAVDAPLLPDRVIVIIFWSVLPPSRAFGLQV